MWSVRVCSSMTGRKKVVKNKEKDRWSKVDFRYMTEESDASDDSNTVYQHKLVWRSEGEMPGGLLF